MQIITARITRTQSLRMSKDAHTRYCTARIVAEEVRKGEYGNSRSMVRDSLQIFSLTPELK